MKDAFEVLYQKEADLVRVRQEIESLTIAASLLDDFSSDGSGWSADDLNKKRSSSAEETISPQGGSEATGTNGRLFAPRNPGFWSAFKRRG